MREKLLAMLAVLSLIYGVLSYIDRQDDYAAEQSIWKINNSLELLLRDSANVPEQSYLDMEKKYKKFAERFPNSYLAPRAFLTIGNMYSAKLDYDRARYNLGEVLRLYPKNSEACAQALTNIGKTYELEGDWPKALESYHELQQRYPLTTAGLENFMYIAQTLQKRGDTQKALVAFEEAAAHYKDFIGRYRGSATEVESLRLLASVYMAQEKWKESVETLGEALIISASLRMLTPPQANVLLKSINTISVVELRDYDMPINIYNKFIERNPAHGLRPVLKKLIKVLETLKANKSGVGTIKL